MQQLLAFSACIDRISKRLGSWLAWLVLITTLVCAYNAVVRKVFNVSSNGLLEIQWYLFGAVFLLGAAYTLADNAHVRIDVLSQRFSIRTQLWIDVLGYVLFMLPLVGFMVMYGWEFAAESLRIREMSADAGGLPRWPAKLLIPAGFSLLGLQVLAELIKKAAMLTGYLPAMGTQYNANEAEVQSTLNALSQTSQQER
ncbi:TRAP transporter small permease subunit [Limnobacter humi]|uniref:TRAP transporter small permease protein n=1 Tax=Limnobacter humi TaxID=1778671 RepID=A0ABT1WEX5_9BURK|nr:TRAP transporter small permease subunit [Limnobacter humi]MCQ8896070.1 TRAP transporter small permease subunit [Limnobacter humi]